MLEAILAPLALKGNSPVRGNVGFADKRVAAPAKGKISCKEIRGDYQMRKHLLRLVMASHNPSALCFANDIQNNIFIILYIVFYLRYINTVNF